MDKIKIAKEVENYVELNLKSLDFNNGLPYLKAKLWEIADREGSTGPEIFNIYGLCIK